MLTILPLPKVCKDSTRQKKKRIDAAGKALSVPTHLEFPTKNSKTTETNHLNWRGAFAGNVEKGLGYEAYRIPHTDTTFETWSWNQVPNANNSLTQPFHFGLPVGRRTESILWKRIHFNFQCTHPDSFPKGWSLGSIKDPLWKKSFLSGSKDCEGSLTHSD
jgi:hypothetical protein